jgi:hypothetical protein
MALPVNSMPTPLLAPLLCPCFQVKLTARQFTCQRSFDAIGSSP